MLRSYVSPFYAGIGKSLFIYYLMWKLALSGKAVIWDRRGIMPVMFSSQGVFEGPLEAFQSKLKDPDTWYVCTTCLFQLNSIRHSLCSCGWSSQPTLTEQSPHCLCCRYLVDGKPPENRAAKTVLVTSPDWDIWKVSWFHE